MLESESSQSLIYESLSLYAEFETFCHRNVKINCENEITQHSTIEGDKWLNNL